MPECCADRGCAPPTADTRALRPLGKSDAPPRSRSRRRRPSGDPELLESPGFPSQSSVLRVGPSPARLASAWDRRTPNHQMIAFATSPEHTTYAGAAVSARARLSSAILAELG